MTPAERARLLERRPDLAERFTLAPNGLVALTAAPCPLLDFDETGRSVCTVHDVRPYNCRRFFCGRPDPAREPFEPTPDGFGCENVAARVRESRPFRRALALVQRKAQRWALAHGWEAR